MTAPSVRSSRDINADLGVKLETSEEDKIKALKVLAGMAAQANADAAALREAALMLGLIEEPDGDV